MLDNNKSVVAFSDMKFFRLKGKRRNDTIRNTTARESLCFNSLSEERDREGEEKINLKCMIT